VIQLLIQGSANRKVAATYMCFGHLNLVDLASSEMQLYDLVDLASSEMQLYDLVDLASSETQLYDLMDLASPSGWS
jgi:hypothetical protein